MKAIFLISLLLFLKLLFVIIALVGVFFVVDFFYWSLGVAPDKMISTAIKIFFLIVIGKYFDFKTKNWFVNQIKKIDKDYYE
jgi:hypothetical protein